METTVKLDSSGVVWVKAQRREKRQGAESDCIDLFSDFS